MRKKTLEQIHRAGFITVGMGIALLLEHLVTYGTFDVTDYLGHEYYGIYAIIIGCFLLALRKANST